MAKTKQISVTTTPTAITVLSVCKSVTVSELQSNASWPTVDFQVYAPTATDDLEYRTKGLSKVFSTQGRAFFKPGDVVGYIALPSGGPTTFLQYEE